MISIIIVSFNTQEILKKCIEAIYDNSISSIFEIIVVDNASSDGSVAMIESQFPEIRLIKNSQNLMFSKANNQGVKISRGSYVLLLNSDAFINFDTIQRMADFMELNKNVAAIGPRVLNFDGTLQSKGYPNYGIAHHFYLLFGLSRLPKRLKQFLFPYYCWEQGDSLEVGIISGCCMLVRRSAWDAIGGLWEKLYFYGEEIEWCQRAINAGYQIWYLGTEDVTHLGGASTSPNFQRKITTSRLKTFTRLQERTLGLPRSFCWALSVCLSLIMRMITLGIFNKNKLKIYKEQLPWEYMTLILFCRKLAKRIRL